MTIHNFYDSFQLFVVVADVVVQIRLFIVFIRNINISAHTHEHPSTLSENTRRIFTIKINL